MGYVYLFRPPVEVPACIVNLATMAGKPRVYTMATRPSVRLFVPSINSISGMCCICCEQEISTNSCGAGAGAQQQTWVASCWQPTEETEHRLVNSTPEGLRRWIERTTYVRQTVQSTCPPQRSAAGPHSLPASPASQSDQGTAVCPGRTSAPSGESAARCCRLSTAGSAPTAAGRGTPTPGESHNTN